MITKKETVAVCIPTYNQASYLLQAVKSILNQTNLPDEIWISDDASTDDTEKVGLKLAKDYPIIKYIRQKSNLGMGGNPNWLMRQPQTDFVAKLDSDDFYNSGYLEELVNLMKKHPKAGYAHSNVNQVNEKSVIERQRLINRKQEYIDGAASLKGLAMGYRVAANIILFRRIAIESVNFWDPNLAFADDWDLAVRLADKGWGNCFSTNILANYRVWSGVANIRQKRILDEIKGVTHIFDNVLTPAFERHEFSMEVLNRRRMLIARHMADCLDMNIFTIEEKEKLKDALFLLSNHASVKRRIRLIEQGFGHIYIVNKNMSLIIKDKLKYIFRKLKS